MEKQRGQRKFIPPVEWIESYFYDPTTVRKFGKDWDYKEAKLLKLAPEQKAILNHCFTPDEEGRFPYDTIVYSTIKKDGKTTLASAIVAWFSFEIESPNLILCLASNQEQSAGRIFGNAVPTVQRLGATVPQHTTSKPEVLLPNGTVIQAIPSNYAGQAGANYGLTAFSELWTYTTEHYQRLYDELVPVTTRHNSIRWIETYVGFEDENELLLGLFRRIFSDSSETHLTSPTPEHPYPPRPVESLEWIQSEGKPTCYHIPEEKFFYFHNHTPMLPWNKGPEGEAYRKARKAELRPAQYIRLFENKWQSSEGDFLEPQWISDSIVAEGPAWGSMVLAGDASVRNDTTSLVGVQRRLVEVFGKPQEVYRVMKIKIFVPKEHQVSAELKRLGAKKHDVDLDDIISQEVEKIFKMGLLLGPFWYDRTELHQVAMNLRKKKVPCREFDQGTDRTHADTLLYQLFRRGQVIMFPHVEAVKHLHNAKAKEKDNEMLRIVKGTINTSAKIDFTVALAMACYRASKIIPVQGDKKISVSIDMI